MPPSFGGTSRCERTRKPCCSSRSAGRGRAGADSGSCRPRARPCRGSPAAAQAARRRPRPSRGSAPRSRLAGVPPMPQVTDVVTSSVGVAEPPRVRLGAPLAGELLELDRRLALVAKRALGGRARPRRRRTGGPGREASGGLSFRLSRTCVHSRATAPRALRVRGAPPPCARARGSPPRRRAAGPAQVGERSKPARSQRSSSPPQSVPSVP